MQRKCMFSWAPQTYAPAFGSNPSLYLSFTWRQMRGKHLRLNIDFCFKLLHGQMYDILLLLVVGYYCLCKKGRKTIALSFKSKTKQFCQNERGRKNFWFVFLWEGNAEKPQLWFRFEFVKAETKTIIKKEKS